MTDSTPDPHDGWTPQPQEQVQPGDPWRDRREPTTKAGQSLAEFIEGMSAEDRDWHDFQRDIVAIEDEAAAPTMPTDDTRTPDPLPTDGHVHQQRYDGDDPYLVCHGCGGRWDAIRGTPLNVAAGVDYPPADVSTPEPGLTEAWAAAEAAVRAWDGTLLVGETNECKSCSGWWATASKRDPADRYQIIESSETGRPRGEHHDATPAAALLALAARLRETP